MRPIDADALKKHVISFTGMFTDELGFAVSMDAVLGAIDFAPTIKAEPVRHGRWIEADYVYFGAKRFECSLCKDDEYWRKRYHNFKEHYCPNCGAKMDGGAEE